MIITIKQKQSQTAHFCESYHFGINRTVRHLFVHYHRGIILFRLVHLQAPKILSFRFQHISMVNCCSKKKTKQHTLCSKIDFLFRSAHRFLDTAKKTYARNGTANNTTHRSTRAHHHHRAHIVHGDVIRFMPIKVPHASIMDFLNRTN